MKPQEAALKTDRATGTLRKIFAVYRWRILFTYGLFNLENMVRLAQPVALGLAIDGLLSSSYRGLLILIVQHMSHLLISLARQIYDTRAFTSIYTDIVTDLVLKQRQREVDVSSVAARSALSREFVDFFEQDIPTVLQSVYSMVGALFILAAYDWTLFTYCLMLFIPAFIINYFYSKRALVINGRLNDELEREVGIIGSFEPQGVHNHYNMVARWRVNLSNLAAANFGIMELFILSLIVVSIIRFSAMPDARPGEILAMFQYIWMFVSGLDSVPMVVQQLSRLRDIERRIQLAASGEDETRSGSALQD
jgi:hypothetical protein